jgi:hypothetical protein
MSLKYPDTEMQDALAHAQESERHPLAEQVEAFIAEFGVSRASFDRATYASFTQRLLEKGLHPHPSTVAAAELHMVMCRAEEPEKMSDACQYIRAVGGYITVSPGGQIQHAPANVPEPRLRRMIDAGILVPTGDSLLDEIPSQTYKLSSIAP